MSIMDDVVAQSPVAGGEIKNGYEASKKDVWFVDSKQDRNPAGYVNLLHQIMNINEYNE